MSWKQQKCAGNSRNVLGNSRNELKTAEMCWKQQKDAEKTFEGVKLTSARAKISTKMLETARECSKDHPRRS
jgi:hypothetical protein